MPRESTPQGVLTEAWDKVKHRNLTPKREKLCPVCRDEVDLFVKEVEKLGYNLQLEVIKQPDNL